MKQMLEIAVDTSPSAEIESPQHVTRHFAKFDEEFFHYCEQQLSKINIFHSEKLSEAHRKYATLRSELTEAQNEGITSEKFSRTDKHLLRKKRDIRKIQELKLAFSEFYLSLVLLQNYQNLNFTGFRKILKKHDKLLNVDFGFRWRQENVDVAHFYTNKDIDHLINETEDVVTQEIEGGDRQKAMKRLRVPPLGELQCPWTTFKVGLFSGSLTVLIVAVIISCIYFEPVDDSWKPALRLYRAPLLLIEFLFLWSINVHGWRRSGVNHILIFELNPRAHLGDDHLMEMASLFGVLWCLSVLCFIHSSTLNIPPYINPLLLYLIMAAFVFNPTKTLRYEARLWTIKVLSRVFSAPFCYVTFADFWVADQLSSIVPALQDFQYFFCFYSTATSLTYVENYQYSTTACVIKAILEVLPPYFRFAQCMRRYRDSKGIFLHIVNGVKYTPSFFITLFASLTYLTKGSFPKNFDNPFFYLLIFANFASAVYSYIWDIKMDWGLLKDNAGDNTFLRDEIIYPSPWIYYFAAIEDFVIRFRFLITVPLIEMGLVDPETMIWIFAPLEVFRRFMWNFFRLENEHLNNCGNFRAIRDISIAPMRKDSDETMLLYMMDEPEGVVHRRKRNSIGNRNMN